jgi:hypothetical protein
MFTEGTSAPAEMALLDEPEVEDESGAASTTLDIPTVAASITAAAPTMTALEDVLMDYQCKSFYFFMMTSTY